LPAVITTVPSVNGAAAPPAALLPLSLPPGKLFLTKKKSFKSCVL